jgi:glycosyltransferase involved in cell wall biosynthesis
LSERPRRIGIDVTAALTQGAGIGRFTRDLVKALVAADVRSEYRLFSAKPPQHPPVPDSLPKADNAVHCPAPFGEQWLYRVWYRLRMPLPVQLVTGELDLYHSPDFVLPPVSGRIPTLLTVHDLSFLHYPDTFPQPLVRYLNRVVPWSIERATHVLADSASTKRDLVSLWHVPDEKISVQYGGVSAHFRPVTDEAQIGAVRERYELGEQPYLLSVGTLQPRKNYEMLIRAFCPIAARWPHNLIIAGGRGWLYGKMVEEVKRLGLSGRVRFIGFAADEDLPALYSGATLFVFPSLYEGFGLPLLEAMACGVPVISANTSSMPELVSTEPPEQERSAMLISPFAESEWTEGIDALLGDAKRRVAMVAAGFREARRFDWQAAARRLLKIYGSLLAK